MTVPILLFVIVSLGLGSCLFWLQDHGHKNVAGALAISSGMALGLITQIGPFWPPFIGFVVLMAYVGAAYLFRWIRDRRRSQKRAQQQ